VQVAQVKALACTASGEVNGLLLGGGTVEETLALITAAPASCPSRARR
jgi:hypothetical protein